MSLDLSSYSLKGLHRESNSQSGTSFGSVEVHSLTLSYIPKSMRCDSRASFMACTFASHCIGREPKAKVATSYLPLTILQPTYLPTTNPPT